MAQHPDSSISGQGSETVYYRSPRIVVTGRWIKTPGRRLLVRELEGVQRVYEYAHPVRKIALICGGAELALAVPLAAVYGAVALLGVGFLIAVGTGVAVLLDNHNNPRWMVLVANYRGHAVALFGTADRRQFEQVGRAVLRAVESQEEVRLSTSRALTGTAGPPGRSVSSRAHRRLSARRSADPA